ncbi:AAA family ATPase, partial [Longimicrobium sp.]|uniref:AAA family ATPase n=1 Tax=Longimicrobium sp. TaxID=2029185 RepID=UPI002E31FF7F
MTQADFFRLGGTSPRMLHLLDGMHASDPDRWIPRRLILQNYWLFDQPETFHFARGNLMLTGQNESGKSTVLVTAITLVLDMMLSPDRVDTMGSNDRSIRYYLIGKDDLPADHPNYHRERTAYIALEFERGASGEHRTIGIGLRSSRDWTNQKVQRWGFVMDGTRRVGIDLHLHDGEQGRPLRPGELRARLGRGGQVFEDQRAYKSAVNEALFGFQAVDDYERFLEMLHVVRTPKLGEGLNPRRVEQYLKDSLPPIESAAIDNVSDVFSRLDAIEAELERLAGQLAAARRLEGPQEDAVIASARLAARAYREAARDHDKRQKLLEDLLSRLEAARAEVARQEAVQEVIGTERADRQGRLTILQDRYRESEAFDIEDRLRTVRKEHGEALGAFEALRADRARAQRALEREEGQLQEAADSWSRQRSRLGEKLDTVTSAARRSFWPALESRAGLARDGLPGARVDGDGPIAADLARSMVEGEAGERRALLGAIVAAMDALASATKKLEDTRTAERVARREYEQADDRYRTAGREAEAARTSASAAIEGWRAECAELRVPDGPMADVLGAIAEYDPQGRRPASVLAPLGPVMEDAQEELRTQRQEREILRRRMDDE